MVNEAERERGREGGRKGKKANKYIVQPLWAESRQTATEAKWDRRTF